jgi:hypothetical protein
VRVRPEPENALALAREIKQAAGDQVVILTVAEMKRLARNAAELMPLAATPPSTAPSPPWGLSGRTRTTREYVRLQACNCSKPAVTREGVNSTTVYSARPC